ncbi:MAG: hypothetical protein NZP74_02620 [Anaerolineales bacterium]|nr:hypothetical protein [Anaerolineales bacterium]MDW8277913.1 hypothetical protein [Anaerolineales bacterium]
MSEQTLIQPEPAPFEPQPAPPKKSNLGLIIGIGAAVVLCCCCLIAGGSFALNVMGPLISNTYATINEHLPPPDSYENGTPSPAVPFDTEGILPQGGLGDETLRADTWFNVVLSAAFAGCSASDPTKVTIEVIQQPDSAGVWKEKWTVTCDSGGKKSFDVTFTPSAQGGTDIEVTESK